MHERLDAKFVSIGHPVHVISNYDNFEVLPPAREAFFRMIRENEQYVLSRMRYSTNACLRRRLRHDFAAARLENRLYHSFPRHKQKISGIRTNGASPQPNEACGRTSGRRAGSRGTSRSDGPTAAALPTACRTSQTRRRPGCVSPAMSMGHL